MACILANVTHVEVNYVILMAFAGYEDWNVHLRIHILLVLVVLLEPFDLGRHWHRIANMSFAYRGNRADIESGFPGFIHERPTLVGSLTCNE